MTFLYPTDDLIIHPYEITDFDTEDLLTHPYGILLLCHTDGLLAYLYDKIVRYKVLASRPHGIPAVGVSHGWVTNPSTWFNFNNISQGRITKSSVSDHDDVIKWKNFPRYWPFVRGIHRSPVNSPHKGQWRGALMFPFIGTWISVWANNREAGDLRRHHAHYDVTVRNVNRCWKKYVAVPLYIYAVLMTLCCTNNRVAGDFRHNNAQCNVIVIEWMNDTTWFLLALLL